MMPGRTLLQNKHKGESKARRPLHLPNFGEGTNQNNFKSLIFLFQVTEMCCLFQLQDLKCLSQLIYTAHFGDLKQENGDLVGDFTNKFGE